MGTEELNENGTMKPSDLEGKIIRQIEYYFGNYNLSKDKFLKQEVKSDDGWVSLETMIKFNRLKLLTEDFQVIADALKKSANQLMEVNEDCTKIRRIIPLPDKFDKEEVERRTLYVKGFKRDTKLDEILDFFQGHKVENVAMRKQKNGTRLVFRGSVFATFWTQEACDEYLEKTGLKFGKTEMLKERKKDYIKRKDIFYDNLRAEKAKKGTSKDSKEDNKEENKEELPDVELTGRLLRVSELRGDTMREHLKEATEKYGTVAFVDYSRGKETAVIRFEEPVVADIIKDAEEEDGVKKLEVNSNKATIALIEGEEEKEYYHVIARNKQEARLRNKNFKRSFDRGGRFNKQRFGKRNRDDRRNYHDDGPPAKQIKADPVKEEPTADKTDNAEDGPPSKRIKTESSQDHSSSENKAIKTESSQDNSSSESKASKTESSQDNSSSEKKAVETSEKSSSEVKE